MTSHAAVAPDVRTIRWRGDVAVDASECTPYTFRTEGPLWWGILGLIAIETAVFSMFIVSYFYLASHNAQWPPGGIDPPKLLLPTINTLVLIASSFTLHIADKGIEKGNQTRLKFGLLASGLLAVVFLVLKVVEYSSVSYRWDTNAYGSIVWLIVGFHSTHVMSLLLKTIVVTIMAFRGYFSATRRMGVIINGIYWHFVVGVWIPLYIVLYWSPRWMK